MFSLSGIVAAIIRAHKYWVPNLANIEELGVEDLKRIAVSARESEDRFAKVFSFSPNMVAVTSVKEGKFIDINEAFTRATGYTRKDVIGRRTVEMGMWYKPEERRHIMRMLETNGRVYNEEVSHRYKSGAVRTCLFSAEFIKIGGKSCMISVATDITERKEAEAALLASEEFANSLLENSPNPITVVYPDTTVKYVNPAFEKLTGFSAAEVVGMKAPYPWWLEERKEERTAGLRNFMSGGARITEQHVFCKDGRIILVELNMVRIMHEGEFRYYLAQWNDITERRRAEEALRESEEKFAKALRASPNVLVVTRLRDNQIIDVNDSFTRDTGYSREEVVGKDAVEVNFWVDTDVRDRIIQQLRERGSASNEEAEFRTKSGELRTALLSAELCSIGGETCMISIANDITNRKQDEEALCESEEKYRDIFENTSELIQSVMPDGRFRYVNNGWKKALGYSDTELANMTLFDVIHPEHVEHCKRMFARVMSGEEVGMVETVLIARNSEKVNIEGNITCKLEDGRPLYTRGIFRDVTKRKYLEENVYRLASAVSMSTDCILITDFDARIIDVNQRTLELFGFATKQEMLGKHFLELIDPAQRATANMDVKTIIDDGQLESREYSVISKDGRRFVLQVTTSLVKDADSQPMGIVRVGREICRPANGRKRKVAAAV